MSGIDLERLLSGRPLAIDRSAFPGLVSQAAARAAGHGPEELAAIRAASRGAAGGLAVRQMGSVCIVPVVGVITRDPFVAWLLGGTSPDDLTSALQQAAADPQTTSIILLVDSPGGEVGLMTETAAAIRQLRATKPITAIARTQMCSAAFWLSAQASRIVATPSASVGSVGVFMTHYDLSAMNERLGVKPTYIASDPRKIEGNEDEPLSDDALTFLQAKVDAVYNTFVNDLAAGRRVTADRVRSTFGSGRAFDATEAVRRGMVDRVGTLESLLPTASSRRVSSDPSYEALLADQDAIMIAVALGKA